MEQSSGAKLDRQQKIFLKSQELAYVFFRLAPSMHRSDFRSRIERLSLDLVEKSAHRDVEQLLLLVETLNALVQLGVSVYEIELVNGRTLIDELSAFMLFIRQSYGFDKLPDVASLFSGITDSALPDSNIADIPKNSVVDFSNTAMPNMSHRDVESINDAAQETSSSGMTNISAKIRQSAILEKIRSAASNGSIADASGCRMKDLMATFPEVSERTIRYDLQDLIERGSIERLGNGGPASFYVMKG